MGVPFEALIPYGIMLALFGVSGAGLTKLRHMQNGGKRGRHSVDQWDRQSMQAPTLLGHAMVVAEEGGEGKANPRTVMERDRRLTGFLRGQTDNVQAPPGFELSHPWKLEKAIM